MLVLGPNELIVLVVGLEMVLASCGMLDDLLVIFGAGIRIGALQGFTC